MAECRVRAVVFREAGWWVAQCLEYDHVSISKSLEELPDVLQGVVMAQILFSLERETHPFHGFPPAPPRFWKMFEDAADQLPSPAPLSLPDWIEVRPEIEARLSQQPCRG